MWDRLALRTLAVKLLFLGALLFRFPAATFEALSTRGDWFLEGRSGDGVERVRADLSNRQEFGRYQWLAELYVQNRAD